MKWPFFTLATCLLIQPAFPFFFIMPKLEHGGEFYYSASIYSSDNCTGYGSPGNPFVKFSCKRECHKADGALSVSLNGRTFKPMSIDVLYRGVTTWGPMALLYTSDDCSGEIAGEARIPQGFAEACITWDVPIQSFQMIMQRDCTKKEFLKEGTHRLETPKAPSYIDWSDPEGKKWAAGFPSQYVEPDD